MKNTYGWFYIVDHKGQILGNPIWGHDEAVAEMKKRFSPVDIAKRGIKVVGEWDGE